MSRISGSRGAVWLSLHAGDPPQQVAYQSAWSVTFTAASIDVTTITDTSARYAKGALSVAGDFSGWLDDATAQAYIAATDGLPRTLIVYPDAATPGRFFTGTVLPDYAAGGGTGSAVTAVSTWAAAAGTTFTSSPGGGYTATYVAVY